MVRIVLSKAVFIGRGSRNSWEEGFLILGVFKGKTRVGCKYMKTKCPECQGTKDTRPVCFWEGNSVGLEVSILVLLAHGMMLFRIGILRSNGIKPMASEGMSRKTTFVETTFCS